MAGSAFFFGTPTARAQDAGALVDALVRKGVLSNQEAEDVRADLTRDLAQTSAGKIKLSNSITELKLYGDLRLRYQYNDNQPQVPDGSNISQQSRVRFRLRLNAEAKLGRDWFAGFSLGTGQASDSEEQTFQDGFDDYNIFITKAYLGWQPNDWLTVIAGKQKNPYYTTDMIWDPDITPAGITESIAFHKLPFFAGGSSGPTGDSSKDGKTSAPSDPPRKAAIPWELTLIAGQFIFDDNNEFALDNDLSTDAYLFVEQLVATWRFSKDTSITVAPGFYTFTAADLSGLTNSTPFTDTGIVGPTLSTTTTTSTVNTVQDTVSANGRTTTRVTTPTTVVSVVTTQTNPDGTRRVLTTQNTARPGAPNTKLLSSVGGVPNAQTTTATTAASSTVASAATPARGSLGPVSGETRQLHFLTAPGDISFKLGGLKSKLYWDFAYNFGGRERFNDIYQLRSGGPFGGSEPFRTRDGLAWLAGLQLGEAKKKGDWQAYLQYSERGIASIDPNLNDSNFALGALNTRGFKLGLAYQLADAVVFSLTGFLTWNLDSNLTGGRATSPGGIANSNSSNLVQADLSIKF